MFFHSFCFALTIVSRADAGKTPRLTEIDLISHHNLSAELLSPKCSTLSALQERLFSLFNDLNVEKYILFIIICVCALFLYLNW